MVAGWSLRKNSCHRRVFTISKTTKAWCRKKTPLVEDLYWNSCGRQGARSLVQKCLLVRVRTWSPSPVWGGGMGENQAGWVHDTSNTRIRLVCIMQFTLIRIRFVWGKNLYLENVVTFRRNSYYSKLPSGCGQFQGLGWMVFIGRTGFDVKQRKHMASWWLKVIQTPLRREVVVLVSEP